MKSLLCLLMLWVFSDQTNPVWTRHVIDDFSRGVDGVRLADVNGDGWMDVATGWEEGGQVRVCLHPGAAKAKQKWQAVTVGEVHSLEDPVFVDLDNDGAQFLQQDLERLALRAHESGRFQPSALNPWRLNPQPSIMIQSYPTPELGWIDENAEAQMSLFTDTVRAVRNLRAEAGVTTAKPINVVLLCHDE